MSMGSAQRGAWPADGSQPASSSGLGDPALTPVTPSSSANVPVASVAAPGTAKLRAEAASLVRKGEEASAGEPAGAGAGERERRWPLAAAARGLALFIGGFTLLSLIGTLRTPAFDANVWWVAPPSVPRPVSLALFAGVGAALVAYGLRPRMAAWRRWSTLALCVAFAAMAVLNMVDFYRVWRARLIEPGVPVPLSLVVAAALGFIAWAALRPPSRPRRAWLAPAGVAGATLVCVVTFPLLQVWFFGTTDYRRQADVAVVFGAQVHDNGRPSTSLRDRMRTAEQLYKRRLVRHLIVSGGVGTSGYNEALVMRDMAVAAGVPRRAVVVDSSGVNTDATVRHSLAFLGAAGWRRVLAVSQFYHLPRIKLAYQRAGLDVLTVPATSSTPIGGTPLFVLREVPAFWLYFMRAVAR